MATIGQTLTSPESGWKRYDDKNSALKYTGTVVNSGGGSFYLTTGTSLEGIGDKLSFSFTGTKLTIMVYGSSGSSFSIMIDGVNEGVCKAFGYGINKVVVAYTTETLSDTKHKVELTMLDYNSVGGDNQRVIFDAIDIDSNGRLLHPDEVTDIKDLDVGKRIRCHYQASSGVVGAFSGLGQETSDFIPAASSATPNGDFYWIMVEDWNKKKILLPDRNIQHTISWDAINNAGIASGSGVTISNTVFGYDAHTQTSVSDLGVTIADTDDTSTATFKVARTTNGKKNGKWYFEATVIGYTATAGRAYRGIIGIMDKNTIISGGNGAGESDFIASVLNVSAIGPSSKIYPQLTATGAGEITTGDTLGFALNLDDGKMSFYKNGVLVGESSIDTSVEWYPFHASKWLSKTTFNFDGRKFKYNAPTGFKAYDSNSITMTVRLMTGGISSTDKDNEWDKYIVSSTLNGTITAGDDNVWNWNYAWSWTSTTNTRGASYRTVRGRSASVGSSSVPTSETVNVNTGFRPILEFESKPSYKSFILYNNEYKKYNSTWTTVSTTLPSVDTFIIEGIDDLSVFDRKSTTFNIPMDDNTTSGVVLGSGKVFKEKVDLKKYFQINSIKVK